MAMIQVENLTRRFGSTVAVREVSFAVQKGEIVGFLGPNGAGKTTTMRILTGSLGATQGRALIGDIDVFARPRAAKRLIGYLPEVPPLYTEMTVRAYLRYAARLRKVDKPKAAVERVIDQVGLRSEAHRLIDHLSKGYRQRVGIAQALVHSPQVLILDEPTSGLDPAQRKEIRELIQELSQGETTVILSTHVLPEVEAVCDRVIIIHKGGIVAQGDISSLVHSGHLLELTVARPSKVLVTDLLALDGVMEVQDRGARLTVQTESDVREQVARLAVEHGLLELSAKRGLEDAFIKLTREETP